MDEELRDEVILSPDNPKTALVNAYRKFEATQADAIAIKQDEYLQEVLAYFKSQQLTQHKRIENIHDWFSHYEAPEHDYLKEPLRRFMEVHRLQFEAAREVLGAVINLHAHLNGVAEPLCVYWGAGYD